MTETCVKVGEGAYAKVYKQTFAVKKYETDESDYALAETKLLKQCNHDRVIKCLGTYIDHKGRRNLILPFYPQSLSNKLHGQTLSQSLVKTYLRQLLEGVAYLHDEADIIHTDLKPQNLLLSTTNDLVICDFSCALSANSKVVQDNNCGTLWYRSPEVLLGTHSHVTCAMDMWAVGCIIWEMVIGKPWFNGNCEIDQIFQIFRVCGTPSETTWPGVSQLINYKTTFPQWASVLSRALSSLKNPQLELLMHEIMVLDPKQRITAAAALKHSYFQEVTQRDAQVAQSDAQVTKSDAQVAQSDAQVTQSDSADEDVTSDDEEDDEE